MTSRKFASFADLERWITQCTVDLQRAEESRLVIEGRLDPDDLQDFCDFAREQLPERIAETMAGVRAALRQS